MNKLTFILILLATLFLLTGCTESKQPPEDTGIRGKGEKEILIARDIGGGLAFSLIEWCGNNALLIYGSEFGIQWIGFNGKKVTISTSADDYPRGCTPDGKWVFYRDRSSARVYKDKFGRVAENIPFDGPGWYGNVIDLYRYEVSTGRRQRFAVVRDDGSSLVSPDGSKVLLGKRHDSAIEMPEPKWETVWLKNDWVYGSTHWFPDSSGILTNIWENGYFTLGIEFFGVEGWSKEFSLDLMRPRKTRGADFGATYVFFEAVVEDNILYFIAMDDIADGRSARKKYSLFRCRIEDRDLTCSSAGGFETEEGRRISLESIEHQFNEDVILKYNEDNCIRRIRAGGSVAECIADTRFEDDEYEDIDMVGVSPDGRWLAIRRGKLPPKPGGRFYAYQYDLFVKKLSED